MKMGRQKPKEVTMEGKYTASQIADWFLCQIDREAGDSITHLKLQKLVYYAQAWTLAFTKHPLFDEEIQAWAHGPVVPSIYHRFKGSKWSALGAPAACPEIVGQDLHMLNEIARVYGKCDARHLEELTHQETPWKETRGDLAPELASSRSISKELMAKFYYEMFENAKAS
jgi:uncharacterized phage-associated protein